MGARCSWVSDEWRDKWLSETSKGLHGVLTHEVFGGDSTGVLLREGRLWGQGREMAFNPLEPEAQLNLVRRWVLPPQGSDKRLRPGDPPSSEEG